MIKNYLTENDFSMFNHLLSKPTNHKSRKSDKLTVSQPIRITRTLKNVNNDIIPKIKYNNKKLDKIFSQEDNDNENEKPVDVNSPTYLK